MPDPSPWWTPHVHADRRPFLLARNRIEMACRRHFMADDFLEVGTPILQVSPGNETHLHAFATDWIAPDGGHHTYYLHTSPEFTCKKLLAAGEPRIFTFARVFRNREHGALHAPEFTMLEWYRAQEPYAALMADCADLLRLAAETVGAHAWRFRGIAADPLLTPERMSVAEAFWRYAGIDLMATVAGHETDREALAAAMREKAIRFTSDDTWSDLFSRILSEKIEPNLGHGRAVILDEYPISEAALARKKPGDERVAERFELYICGVEIANAFGELTDADEQRQRFETDMAAKAVIYGERYPIDADFLQALALMPEASGAALGFDRLAMLATGATRIDQVMWAPFVDVRL